MKRPIYLKIMMLLIAPVLLTLSCKEDPDWEAREIEQIEDFLAKQDMVISPKPDGLYYKDVVIGTGDVAQAYDTVEIRYSGFFLSGIKFDSNLTYPDPLRFVLWDNSYVSLIDGFHDAVSYMKEGGEAFVILPSWLAYGSGGSGNIPGYTPIIFELELVKIDRGPGIK